MQYHQPSNIRTLYAPQIYPRLQHKTPMSVHKNENGESSPAVLFGGKKNPAFDPAPAKHSVPFSGLSFHNPFDVNSYPLTNPPLYDPTMLPLGAPGGMRRRRISISNGQIGQIVNHEAFYIDEDSLDEYYDSAGNSVRPGVGPAPQDDSAIGVRNPHIHSHEHASISANNLANLPVLQPAVSGQITLNDAQHISVGAVSGLASGQPLVNAALLPVAGVPPQNHTLVYNNEVIYNPHDGPIPGTAAWKKERLLERNRVAASKCRQRKKTAQKQLEDTMAKHEKDLREKDAKLKKAEQVLAMYNASLQRYFQGDPRALEALRAFSTHSLDQISF